MSQRLRFEQVALPHMDAAFNLARHLLGQRADAEDAVQDAFVRAYRAYHQLEGDDIKPWLLTIVRNVCYRRLQQRRRASNVISFDEAINPGAAVGGPELRSGLRSPEETAIGVSEQTLVSAVIADLPPAFREVIVLREIEELSYREIADIIGAPVGTVMSRLARARSQLKARLTRLLDRDESDAM